MFKINKGQQETTSHSHCFFLAFLNTQIYADETGELKEPDIFYKSKQIDVPEIFKEGVGWRDVESDYEHYLSNYRRGWWRCVEVYVKIIDYKYSESDSRISGHVVAISGFYQAYIDAEEIMQKNIKTFGKSEVHKYLIEIWEGY